MAHKQQVGIFGQKLAVEFLQQKQYRILAENYSTRRGEIDIVAQQDGQLVFVEVKTRLSRKYGLPEEAVSKLKRQKMQWAAYKYLTENNINSDNFRFDILAIEIDKDSKRALIRHHKNLE
jgi:putative endonuclease